MSDIQFAVKGPKAAIGELVNIASGYASSSNIDPMHLKSILFDAKDEELVITAESRYSGVEIVNQDESVEIVQEGRAILQASWLTQAMSVIRDNETVELIVSGNHLVIKASETSDLSGESAERIRFDLPDQSKNAILPEIGETNEEHGVSFKPDAFIDAYRNVSIARLVDGDRPAYGGVYMRYAEEGDHIRLFATNSRNLFSSDTFDVETIGDGISDKILEHSSTVQSLGLMQRGDKVSIHFDSNDRVHVLVHSSGNVLYHIRTAILDFNVKDYHADKMIERCQQFSDMIENDVKVEGSDLIRVMSNAATIGGLDRETFGGSKKEILMSFSDSGDELTVSIPNGRAQYNETIPVKTSGLDGETNLLFPWGFSGDLLRTYHDEENVGQLRFGLMMQNGQPRVLFTTKEDLEKGVLPSFFGITSVSPAK